jgi:hypothetical protein
MAIAADDPTELPDEPDWIRHRIESLRGLRRLLDDDRALAAINALIAEAEERLAVVEKK